jgi:DNA-binding XRE family transcriptional regulator
MITRIRELLETRQLTPTQFADLIGVGRPVISHILSERNKPSLEVVQKIIGAFPEVSLHWLLTGIGSMQASATPAVTPVVAPLAPAEPQPAPPTPIPSPQVPQTAGPIATPATRQAPLPLPPKFRPAARASSQLTTASPSPAPIQTVIPTAPVEAPAPIPIAPLVPEAVVAPPPVPAAMVPTPVPMPVMAAPSAANSLNHLLPPDSSAAGIPALTQATAPVSTPMAEPATAPLTNQAAALSFLGEPGKAIRRIVIFYRDGSFSDYVPEGF